jgi:hypothetical protein
MFEQDRRPEPRLIDLYHHGTDIWLSPNVPTFQSVDTAFAAIVTHDGQFRTSLPELQSFAGNESKTETGCRKN